MLYRKVLEKRKAKIKQQIDEIFQEAEDIDRREDEIYGESTPHTTGQPLTDKIKRKIEAKLSQQNKKQLNKLNRHRQALKRQPLNETNTQRN